MAVGDPVFVDTNILIYASRPKASEHAAAQAMLGRMRRESSPLWLSHQVLREYLAASTRPQRFGPALPMSAAIADVERFRTGFNIAEDSAGVFNRLVELLSLRPGGGKQVHDTNIVATMLARGITRLLTFNAADFQRFNGLIEILVP
jgi:predicted nucleic acid-binding protein